MEKYKLTDYQWKQIEPLILSKTSKCGRARRNLCELIDAIIWLLRTGTLPKEYGSYHIVYNNLLR